VGAYATSVWRIGLMGPNAAPDKVTLVLGALREVLGR
jgi:alanine-glyoxylate transaminase/serine-glyoxylate transaminase/serine-pyruvate transaminase